MTRESRPGADGSPQPPPPTPAGGAESAPTTEAGAASESKESDREAGEEGASNGTVVLDSASDNPDSTEDDWPLADGTYDVYFVCCENYDVLAGPVKLEIASDGD